MAARKKAWKALTAETWDDFEALMGKRGACGGCWCMAWRQTAAEYKKFKGEANHRSMKRLVMGGESPGVLLYEGGEAVGWCSVAPRECFVHLRNSPVLQPVDEQPVWSVTCFFVRRDWRRRGLSVRLLKAAGEFVKSQGGKLLEGYPVIAKMKSMPDVFAWTGVVETFQQAGFAECQSKSKGRKIMRKRVGR